MSIKPKTRNVESCNSPSIKLKTRRREPQTPPISLHTVMLSSFQSAAICTTVVSADRASFLICASHDRLIGVVGLSFDGGQTASPPGHYQYRSVEMEGRKRGTGRLDGKVRIEQIARHGRLCSVQAVCAGWSSWRGRLITAIGNRRGVCSRQGIEDGCLALMGEVCFIRCVAGVDT